MIVYSRKLQNIYSIFLVAFLIIYINTFRIKLRNKLKTKLIFKVSQTEIYKQFSGTA